MLKIAILALMAALTAHADEMNDWFGTFTVEQTLHKETTETYPPGNAYFQGQQPSRKQKQPVSLCR